MPCGTWTPSWIVSAGVWVTWSFQMEIHLRQWHRGVHKESESTIFNSLIFLSTVPFRLFLIFIFFKKATLQKNKRDETTTKDMNPKLWTPRFSPFRSISERLKFFFFFFSRGNTITSSPYGPHGEHPERWRANGSFPLPLKAPSVLVLKVDRLIKTLRQPKFPR